jgi:hypothetical protein
MVDLRSGWHRFISSWINCVTYITLLQNEPETVQHFFLENALSLEIAKDKNFENSTVYNTFFYMNWQQNSRRNS